MMSRVKEFMNTLPMDDVRKVNEWIKRAPNELSETEEQLIQEIIRNISWDYKTRAEYASAEEARKLEATKEELYNKWEKMGFI